MTRTQWRRYQKKKGAMEAVEYDNNRKSLIIRENRMAEKPKCEGFLAKRILMSFVLVCLSCILNMLQLLR